MIPVWLQNLSVWANTRLGGMENASLCAQFWCNRLHRGGWFWKTVTWCVDKLFWFEPQHCRKAYLRRGPCVKK